MGVLLVLLSAACFGALGIFGKLAYDDDVGVLTLLFTRFAMAGLVFGGLRLSLKSVRTARLSRRTAVIAFGLGAVGYATQAGLYFAALQHADVSLLALLFYTYPAFVTIAAVALGREAATVPRVAGLIVASGGVALVLAGGSGGGIGTGAASMAIAAALTYTTYILVADTVAGEVPPVLLSAVVALGASFSFGVVGLLAGSLHFGFEPEGWLWLACIALVSTVAAVLAFFSGLARVGPASAAILSTFEPPVTVLLAFLVFGDRLSGVQLVGGALVLGAVAILQLPSKDDHSPRLVNPAG